MLLLQSAALCIVALYTAVRCLEEHRRIRFLSRMVLLSASAWAAEESAILFYGFYHYSPQWSLFLHRVPLVIVLIWPAVIHSGWDMASQILPDAKRLRPLLAGVIVCTDAGLIEPLAVQAGLWAWEQPGLFHVPPVAILGWGGYAFLCILTLERFGCQRTRPGAEWRLLALPPLGVHAFLLSSWWAIFRWVNSPVSPVQAAAGAWGFFLCVTGAAFALNVGKRVERKVLLLRLPGAVFFFVLLAVSGRDAPWLVLYASAFVPPYLALLAQQGREL